MRNRVVCTSTLRLRQLLVCAVAVALLTGCSGIFGATGDDGGADKSAKSTPTRDKDAAPDALQSQWMLVRYWVRVDLLALDRTSNGVVTARIRLANTGDETFDASYHLGASASAATYGDDASGVTLEDAVALKRHYPYFSTDGKCACSDTETAEIAPRESREFFASFPAPRSKVVSVSVPNTPSFLGVRVRNKPGPVKPGRDQPTRDASKMDLDDPNVVPLNSRSESVDGAQEEEQRGEQVEVRLSSDVLFALNKAELSAKAQEELEDVAAKIDDSDATVVKVDGHTDDSGTDAINEPLSRRRAAAVRDKLSELVSKDGVTYQVRGHGSADPLVSNDSEENRKRNRRVSVTFAR